VSGFQPSSLELVWKRSKLYYKIINVKETSGPYYIVAIDSKPHYVFCFSQKFVLDLSFLHQSSNKYILGILVNTQPTALHHIYCLDVTQFIFF